MNDPSKPPTPGTPEPGASLPRGSGAPDGRARGRIPGAGALGGVVLPAVSIGLALIVGAIMILVAELLVPNRPFDLLLPLTAYRSLFQGAVGSVDGIVSTFVFTTPLILAGLAVGLGFKGGLFNIGAQGQFLMGALTAVWVGVMLSSAPAIVAIPAALAAGMLGGALWGFVPGALKALSGAHEVVTTIMLNYVAIGVLAAMVSGPLQRPGAANPETGFVGNAGLPILIGREGHIGLLFALIAAALVAFLLYRTTLGFEIRTAGANPDAARYAGMRPAFLVVLTMSLSGLLAGAAGAVQVLGISHQMTAAYGTTVGFDSIAVALLGRSNPLGIVFAALLFGAMRAGAGLMQIQAGIPPELVDVLQATILLFLVANPVLGRILRLRRAAAGVDLSESETFTRSYSGQTAVR